MKLERIIGLLLALSILVVGGCSAKRPSATPVDAESIDPVSLDAVKAYEAGDSLKSLELYRSLVAAEPSNHVYLNNMGVLLLKGGLAQEALDAFESASLLAPNNTDYLINVGFAQLKLEGYDESLDFFDRALQLAPRHARALYGKGVAYLYLNEPEIALGLFRQAVIVAPSSTENLFMKAYASQKNNLWMDAVKDYTAYIGLSTERIQKANAYSNRALCYFQLSDYKSGMADLDKAMELNDASAIYYYNRAQGYQMRQNYEDAVKDYTRAISRNSSLPEAYINRGELRFLMDKKSKGCRDLKRACDLGVCGPWEKYEAAGKCEN